MLDFNFSEEQELFRRTVREFCQKKIAPIVRDLDKKERIPDDVIKGMAELGLMGITAPPEFGCAGADPLLAGIAGEELGRVDITCATAVFYLVPASWGHVLNRHGNPETKKKVFPSLAKGKSFLGIATTEPEIGSDLANMKTVAKRVGDEYVITGEKMYISGVREVMEQLEEGGGFLTLVKTSPEKGNRGMSFLYVPLKGTPGVSYTILDDMGRRGISTGGFKLDNVRVPASNLVGEENKGFYVAMEGFDYARAIIAAVCSGAAMSALEQGMEYIKQRKAFGQPIGRYEGIQFKLAEDYAKIDAVRLLAYRALWMLGQEIKEKKYSRFEVTKAIAEAKMLAPQWAFETINDVLQWYGAYGYTTECPIEAGLRGARSYMWAEGSTEIMKIIVARELLGKEFIAYR
jgi:acyl-CoA dehydrogenase